MDEANKLMHDMSATENHTAQLESDVKTIDTDLNTLDQDLLVSKKINTALGELNTALGEAVQLLEIVAIIPEIGAEASELKTTISTFKVPIANALNVSNKLESVIGPVRTKIEQIEPKVKQIDTALLNTMNAENKFISVLGDATHCINALPAGNIKTELEGKLNAAANTVDPVVLKFDSAQVALLNAINDAKTTLSSITVLAGTLATINAQINAVFAVLNPLISGLNSVKNALSHTIRVPYGGYPKFCKKWGIPYPCGWHTVYFSFSVEQILKGGLSVIGPVMSLLNDAMKSFLNPILSALHLNINLPSIPGLGNLENLANALENSFSSVENALSGLVGNLNQFDAIISQIEAFENEVATINQACTTSITA